MGLTSRFKRLQKLFAGQFVGWIQQNNLCLQKLETHMTIEAIHRAQLLASIHQVYLYKRLVYFFQSGVRRQSMIGNVALLAVVALNQL
jgi:hypothetical protein